MSLAAIDLGNSRIKVAVPDSQGNPVMQSNDVGELFTHSVVYFGEDETLVGTEALNCGLADPSRCVRNWKRHMGSDKVLHTRPDGTELRARDVAQILLAHVARVFEQRTGSVLSEAAISVPANYIDEQKAETIAAAEACGIEVIVTPHEPTAAAFGNKVQDRGDGLVVLLDLGGGTFDVSIVRVSGNTVEVMATNGEAQLGGQDFNQRIIQFVFDEFEHEHGVCPEPDENALEFSELQQRVEQAKLTLSVRESANITFAHQGQVLSVNISREEFGRRTSDLVDLAMKRAEQTLADAGVTADDVREFVPVGGASQMISFLDGIEERFGKKPSFYSDPYYAVALGCVTVARLTKERSGEQVSVNGRMLPPLEHRMHEVTAHPIGIGCLDSSQRVVCSVVLPKGTPIPSDQTKAFQLAEPGQTAARIEILQAAEGTLIEDSHKIGFFEIDDLDPVESGVHRIDIRCRLDQNSMFNAEARDPRSGKREELTIDYKNT